MFEDRAFRLFADRNLAIAHWLGAPTPEHFVQISRLAARQRDEHPAGCAFISRVSSAKLPRVSLGMRHRLRSSLRGDDRDLASAHIIELEGIPGRAARRIVSLIMSLLGHRAPSGVFAAAPAAVDFLLPHLERGDVAWDAAELTTALTTR